MRSLVSDKLKDPAGVCIDEQHGEVIVSSYLAKCIVVFKKDGSVACDFHCDRLSKSYGVAYDSASDTILVACLTVVCVFDREGRLQRTFGLDSSRPRFIAVSVCVAFCCRSRFVSEPHNRDLC